MLAELPLVAIDIPHPVPCPRLSVCAVSLHDVLDVPAIWHVTGDAVPLPDVPVRIVKVTVWPVPGATSMEQNRLLTVAERGDSSYTLL